MDRDMFADDVVLADDYLGGFAAESKVLRKVSDNCAGVDAVLFAEFGPTGEVNVRTNFTSFGDDDIFVDDRVWSDRDAHGDARVRMDNGGRMYHRRTGKTRRPGNPRTNRAS